MPGDLRDDAQFFPFYFDSTYELGENNPHGSPGVESYIQGIAVPELGYPLSGESLALILIRLKDKGFLHRNWGGEEFQNEVKDQINKIKSARKVLHAFTRLK